MTTLRQMFAERLREWPDADVDPDELVEVVSTWLTDDAIRTVIYDGMVAPGPTTANIAAALASEAVKEEEPDDQESQSTD